MKASVGCPCDAFADACERRFVRCDGEHFWLADLERGPLGAPGYSRAYGPKIEFCPFCGTTLTAGEAKSHDAEAAG
jgi:hypothetical protein